MATVTTKTRSSHHTPLVHTAEYEISGKTNATNLTNNVTSISITILSGFGHMKSILGDDFCKAIYVLLVLTICNIFVQIDIFLIGVTAKEMQTVQNWGDGTGTGTEYDVLAGPIFTFAHIIGALPVGFIIDRGYMSDEVALFGGMFIWSASVVLTGYSEQYWHVAVCRGVLALFTAIAGVLCVSIIADYFPSSIRSSACALWNFAIYIGFSAAYGAGNAISEALDWRYTWWIFGYAGIFWSFLVLVIKLASTGDDSTSLMMDDHLMPQKSRNHECEMSAQSENAPDLNGDIDHNKKILSLYQHNNNQHNNNRLYGTVISASRTENFGFNEQSKHQRNDTGTTMGLDYDESSVMIHNHMHNEVVLAMQQHQITMNKVLLYLTKTPSLVLLLFASFYRNCGGYIWAYQADNFFVNEKNDSNYTISTYLSWVPMVAGSIGCLLGGYISDKLARHHMIVPQSTGQAHRLLGVTIIRRIWVLVFANLLSFPFAAGVIVLESPYCYLSLFGMYIFSEMWISIAVTLVIEFSPSNMKATMLSVYYFVMGLAGFAPLLVTPFEHLFHSYWWSMFVLFPCVYGSSSILFFFVICTYKKDLNKKIERYSFGAEPYNPYTDY